LNRNIAEFFWAIDLPILEGYGLTETAPVISTNPMVRAKAGTVGKVLPNLEVKIAPDGEILVRGPSVMKGYYKNEQATAEAFDGDWLKTGDLGELDEDGYLRIIDRKKRILVLSTGKNVAPQPVENAMNESRYIEYSLLVGDRRKYVIALIKPDYEELFSWAKNNGIEEETYDGLLRHEAVQQLLKGEVERQTAPFADFEKPKKLIVAAGEWSVESGELTPKLSIRLNVVEQKYRSWIERAYAEEDGGKEKQLKIVTAS